MRDFAKKYIEEVQKQLILPGFNLQVEKAQKKQFKLFEEEK